MIRSQLRLAYRHGQIWIANLAMSIIGIILLYSATIHLLNPIKFYVSILQYRIIPNELSLVIAFLLPSTEFIIGFGLLFRAAPSLFSLLASLLFSLFAMVHWSMVIAGKNVPCGCFGDNSEPISVFSATLVSIGATTIFLAFLIAKRSDRILTGSHESRIMVSIESC
jgi:hypothetical protein